MKLNLKTTGQVEIESADLVAMLTANSEVTALLREFLASNKKEFIPMLTAYLQKERNLKFLKLEADKSFKKILVLVEQSLDEGVQGFSSGPKTNGRQGKKDVDKRNRKWTGFYDVVQDIVNEQKNNKKHFISLSEIYDLVLNTLGGDNKPKFIKNGEQIELTRVKQYLSPSQLARQTNMRGIEWDKRREGLKF
jgi:hypothetical protein